MQNPASQLGEANSMKTNIKGRTGSKGWKQGRGQAKKSDMPGGGPSVYTA